MTGSEGTGPGAIHLFRRNEVTGELFYVQRMEASSEGFSDGFDDILQLAAGVDPSIVYATSELATISSASRLSLPQGRMDFVETLRDGEGGVSGISRPTGIALSPDGLSAFVVSPDDQTLSAYNVAALSGELEPAGIYVDGVGGVDGLAGPAGVAVSPDGANVYVAGSRELAVFDRAPSSGSLTFAQVLVDGINGAGSISFANSVVVAPDGFHVYTLAGDRISEFARSTSGTLTYLRTTYGGTFAGVPGLTEARDLVFSPDGANAYVAASRGDSLLVFARDSGTGQLTSIQRLQDGVGGVGGLNGASAVAVSPDGAHVYAVSAESNAVTIYERAIDGTLTQIADRREAYQAPALSNIHIASDQGCPSGLSAADGFFTASYGACSSNGALYVGRSPADVTARHLSYWKYVIAHEVGHMVNSRVMRLGFYGDYGAGTSVAGVSPMCKCDHVVTANRAHCFQSLEDIGSAASEGFAHFYAARTFNEIGEGDCTFVYYKDYLTSPAAGAPVLGPPVPIDCQTPLRIHDTYCDLPVPNLYNQEGGVEADWMHFLWLAHQDPLVGSTLEDLREILGTTLRDGDFIEVGEIDGAAVGWFGAGPKAAHVSQSRLAAGLD